MVNSLIGGAKENRDYLERALGTSEHTARDYLSRAKRKRLEKIVGGVFPGAGFIFGIFLLFSGFSNSNIQLSPSANSVNWQLWNGIILLLVGLVGGFFWVRNRK